MLIRPVLRPKLSEKEAYASLPNAELAMPAGIFRVLLVTFSSRDKAACVQCVVA